MEDDYVGTNNIPQKRKKLSFKPARSDNFKFLCDKIAAIAVKITSAVYPMIQLLMLQLPFGRTIFKIRSLMILHGVKKRKIGAQSTNLKSIEFSQKIISRLSERAHVELLNIIKSKEQSLIEEISININTSK